MKKLFKVLIIGLLSFMLIACSSFLQEKNKTGIIVTLPASRALVQNGITVDNLLESVTGTTEESKKVTYEITVKSDSTELTKTAEEGTTVEFLDLPEGTYTVLGNYLIGNDIYAYGIQNNVMVKSDEQTIVALTLGLNSISKTTDIKLQSEILPLDAIFTTKQKAIDGIEDLKEKLFFDIALSNGFKESKMPYVDFFENFENDFPVIVTSEEADSGYLINHIFTLDMGGGTQTPLAVIPTAFSYYTISEVTDFITKAKSGVNLIVKGDATEEELSAFLSGVNGHSDEYSLDLTYLNITSLPDTAFTSEGLTSITLPKTLTSIGAGCFSSCSSLTKVIFTDGGTNWKKIENKIETAIDVSNPETNATNLKGDYSACSLRKAEDLVVNGVTYNKTELVTVFTETKTITETTSAEGLTSTGVFVSGRNVEIAPYAIGKYEVTKELFKAVFGEDPSETDTTVDEGESDDLRPVNNLSWFVSVAFCNKLTLLTGGSVSDLVYSVKINDEEVNWADLKFSDIPTEISAENYNSWLECTYDITKTGYRLPTEAEWECAARGGDQTDATTWNYLFAGTSTYNDTTSEDDLTNYAWYKSTATTRSYEVGVKLPNSLGIYDMTGNVYEWVSDWYASSIDSTLENKGPDSGSLKVVRGGSFSDDYAYCYVSYRGTGCRALYCGADTGLRLARTLPITTATASE